MSGKVTSWPATADLTLSEYRRPAPAPPPPAPAHRPLPVRRAAAGARAVVALRGRRRQRCRGVVVARRRQHAGRVQGFYFYTHTLLILNRFLSLIQYVAYIADTEENFSKLLYLPMFIKVSNNVLSVHND